MGNVDETTMKAQSATGQKRRPGNSGFSARDTHPDVNPQGYPRMLELYDPSFRNLAEGEVVKGTVVKVTPTEVVVDVGFKSEGVIPVEEFIDESGQVQAQPGDIVD